MNQKYVVLGQSEPNYIGDLPPFEEGNVIVAKTLATALEQLRQPENAGSFLMATADDVALWLLQRQKMEVIHEAGMELAELSPQDLAEMSVKERVELLKARIIFFTQDLLNFQLVEVRLLDEESGRLNTLLSHGMEGRTAGNELYAEDKGNGIAGHVAYSGESYLCEDTLTDPYYLRGAKDAMSSLTVPLFLQDRVIGTFNVESLEKGAFSEDDQRFLEQFARNVATAINQFDLLAAEQYSACRESVAAIHRAVALPIDEILNNAVLVMEKCLGTDPELVENLRTILCNARDVKKCIVQIGQNLRPGKAVLAAELSYSAKELVTTEMVQFEWQPPEPASASTAMPCGCEPLSSPPVGINGARVLVVDQDPAIRASAHDLLEEEGCLVETAHNPSEAIAMVKSAASGADAAEYDVVISDVKFDEMTGYELMVQLGKVLPEVRLILMTGYGWDPSHTIVKARRDGLKHVLYKPFLLDQLTAAIEDMRP